MPPFGEEPKRTRSPSNTKSPGLRPSSIPSDILIHAGCSHWTATDMGRKLVAVTLWGGGTGSPSYTMWPGPSPTCMRSFVLIRRTVWPQCTNVTDRQTDRTGQTDRQRTDSIGRTVLQTVAQKPPIATPCVEVNGRHPICDG